MEPAAAWGPSYEFQLADWTVEVWAPAPYSGLPVKYASIDIFGSGCSLPAYVPQSVVGQEQFVEYYFSADPRRHGFLLSDVVTAPAAPGNTTGNQNEDPKVFNDEMEKEEKESKADIDRMKEKMHKYPARLRHLDKSYF